MVHIFDLLCIFYAIGIVFFVIIHYIRHKCYLCESIIVLPIKIYQGCLILNLWRAL